VKDKKGDEWKTFPLQCDAPVSASAVGRFNADKIVDLAVLTEHPPELYMYAGNKRSIKRTSQRTWQPTGNTCSQPILTPTASRSSTLRVKGARREPPPGETQRRIR
jgi:hypothetical protein